MKKGVLNYKKIGVFIIVLIIILLLANVLFRFILPVKFMKYDSASMQHKMFKDNWGTYSLCGNSFSERETVNFDKYWEICGEKYNEFNISKDEFLKFPLNNGINKYEVIASIRHSKLNIGDIIVFRPNLESQVPKPIQHRIVKINKDGTFYTQGDGNPSSLTKTNNIYRNDETAISEEQIIGKVTFKIPWYLFYIINYGIQRNKKGI